MRRLRAGAGLRVAFGPEWTLVVGDDLPWADGVTYLGWDDGLLVPTTLAPSTPAGLLRHSLPGDARFRVQHTDGGYVTVQVSARSRAPLNGLTWRLSASSTCVDES